LFAAGFYLHGRQLLLRVAEQFQTSREHETIQHVEGLFAFQFSGGIGMLEQWLTSLDTLLAAYNGVPDPVMLHALILRALRKLPAEFSLDLQFHDRALPGSELRTYQHPRRCADLVVERRRSDAVRTAQLQALTSTRNSALPAIGEAKAAKEPATAKAKATSKAKATPASVPKLELPNTIAAPAVCFAFRNHGKCDKGDKCIYAHSADSARSNASSSKSKGKSKGKGKGKGKAASRADDNKGSTPPASPRQAEACRLFLTPAGCSCGEKCRFLHTAKASVARIVLAAAALACPVDGFVRSGSSSVGSCDNDVRYSAIGFRPDFDWLEYGVDKLLLGSTASHVAGTMNKRARLNAQPLTDDQLSCPAARLLADDHARLARNRASSVARSLGFDRSSAPTPAMTALSQIEWTIDSGAGISLISQTDADENGFKSLAAPPGMILLTANGEVSPKASALVPVEQIGVSNKHIILPSTPPVLSMGQLVIDHGCTITWSSQGFELTSKQGDIIPTRVVNYVPLLQSIDDARKAACMHEEQVCQPARKQSKNKRLRRRQATPAQQAAQPVLALAEPNPQGGNNPGGEDGGPDARAQGHTPKPPRSHYLTHLPAHPGCEVCAISKQK
jgi:hypothetical protein